MVPVSLDIETTRIQPGKQAPEMACVALHSQGYGLRGLYHWTEYKDAVLWALTDPNVVLLGHHIAFDMSVILADDFDFWPFVRAAYEADRVVCTEIRAKLLDIATGQRKFHSDGADGGESKFSGYSLEALSKRHLNRQLDKNTWRLQYGELRPLPLNAWPEGAREYPLEDTRAAEDLYYVQEQHPARATLVDQHRQTRAALWIQLMRAWGLRTDREGVRALIERLNIEYDTIARDLRLVGLLREDRVVKRRGGAKEKLPGSRNVKAVGERVIRAYTALGKEYPRTNAGAPCTDSQTCEDSGDPVLVQYSRLSSIKKMLSTDVPLLQRGLDEPIHSRFEACKETGRTGSADPNVQNLARTGGIRECFVPSCLTCGRVHDKGDISAKVCLQCGSSLTVYITCDYSGAELCTLGQVCLRVLGWSTLAEALNQDRDPHVMLASQTLGAPYEVLKRVHDTQETEGLLTWEIVDNTRQTAKIGNFGFPGGLGAPAFVHYALNNYGVRISIEQARELKRYWLATWPEMRDYFKWINWHTEQPEPRIEQLFSGRIRGFTGQRVYTEACNTMFQGLAADMAKHAGWLIQVACYDPMSPLYGCRIVNFIHDEFILLCQEDRAHDAAHELSRLMLLAAKEWVPDVKVKAKPLISRRLSKRAKQVWEGGRLVPWDLQAAA